MGFKRIGCLIKLLPSVVNHVVCDGAGGNVLHPPAEIVRHGLRVPRVGILNAGSLGKEPDHLGDPRRSQPSLFGFPWIDVRFDRNSSVITPQRYVFTDNDRGEVCRVRHIDLPIERSGLVGVLLRTEQPAV